MRNVKKIMMVLVAMLSFVFAMQFSVSAASTPAKIAKSDFNLYADGGVLRIYYTGSTDNYNGLEIEVKNLSSGSTKIYATTYLSNSIKISKRVGYRVRMRGVWKDRSGKVIARGAWSSARYDVESSFKVSLGKNTTFNVKLYKAKGVKSYTVYVSKKKESGYKKVGTYAVSGKTKTVNVKKCGSSKIKKYTTYYIKVVANVKAGSKTAVADTYQLWYGHIYTTYK